MKKWINWITPLVIILIVLLFFFNIIVIYDSFPKYPNVSHIAEVQTLFLVSIIPSPSSSLITFFNILNITSKIIALAFVLLILFSFYKIVKEESVGKSILYLFLYTLVIVILSFLTILISFQIEPPRDMGGLAIIIVPIYTLILFGVLNTLILIAARIVNHYKI